MIFCQVKSTLKYTNITRCNKKLCECFQYALNRNTEHRNPVITMDEFYKYRKCYNMNTPDEDKKRSEPFLL